MDEKLIEQAIKTENRERVEALKEKIDRLETELAIAKLELSKAYNNFYPLGRFLICRKTGYGQQNGFEIWWENGQVPIRTIGFSNSGCIIQRQRWRCSIMRKTTQYDSLEKLLKAADKFGLPKELIDTFTKEYKAYAS